MRTVRVPGRMCAPPECRAKIGRRPIAVSSRSAEKALAQSSVENTAAWYVVEFVVPEGRLAEPQLPTASFPGLIFYYYRDGADGSVRLVSYWSSREVYSASCRPFSSVLRVEEATAQGFVQALSLRRKPLWQRVSPYQVILHVVALLGALSALQAYYAQLFEAPDVVAEVDNLEGLNFREGQPLEIQLKLLNRSRDLPVDVRGITVALSAAAPAVTRTVSLPSPSLPAPIQEKGSSTVALRGPAFPSGLYNLQVTTLAKSGYLRGSHEIPLVFLPLRVWGREPEAALLPVEIIDGKPWLRGKVEVSADTRLFCQVRILFEPGIRFGPLEFPGVVQWSDPIYEPMSGREVAVQSWDTPPLTRYRPESFRLALEGNPHSGWDALLKNSHLYCSPQKGETS